MDVNKTEIKEEDSSNEYQEEQTLIEEKEAKQEDETREMTVDKTPLSEPQNIEPLVIPAKQINKKQKYVSQFELVLHGRGILLCETYYDQKCIWQKNKGCLKMYIPIRQMHARSDEWYVYPAARLFAGEYPLCMNLSLNPKLRPVFSPRDIKLEENYLHIRYRKQRQKGIVLPAGMLLGSLYLNEPWLAKPTSYVTPEPMYPIKYAR